MAQDWIKIEKQTLDKPEVAIIAAALQIDPDAALGKLVRIWAWFDSNTTDGVTSVTVKALLDRIAGVTGFMAAMEMAGWCAETLDGKLVIPNFARHMGKSAKTRALTALRVAKVRAETRESRKGNAESVTDVTHAPLANALPDRERERDSTHTHTAGAREGADGSDEPDLSGGSEGSPAPLIPRAGFPTRQQVLDYAASQGWSLEEAAAFWLHHDDRRSQGEPYSPHWHWWSKLEKWILDNARLGPRGAGGSRSGRRGPAAGSTPAPPSDWAKPTNPSSPPTAA